MSDEVDTAEAGKFAPKYPLWVLFRQAQLAKAPDSQGVVPFRQPSPEVEVGPLLLIFTNEEIADAFIKSVPISDLWPHAVNDSKVLFTVCKYFKANGCNSVAVDYTLPDGRASFYAIEEIMRDILDGKHDR